MHALFIPSWYPPTPTDTYGSFFREQALALRRHGITVGVIAPALRSLSEGLRALCGDFGLREEIDEGLPTLRFHGVRAFSWHHGLNLRFWEWSGLRAFERYQRNHGKPDLLHVHATLFGLAWARAIHRRHGIPFVVTEHSSEFALNPPRPHLMAYLADTLPAASRCFCVSSALSQRMSSLFPSEKIGKHWEVMPNLVSARFAVTCNARRDADFTFLNVAGLNRNKGQHHLLVALAELRRHGAAVPRLRIVGTGPEESALKELARTLELEDLVTFVGPLPREQVAHEMAHCDALVLASRYETFGVVAVEALTSGKPVVSTRSGGPEDIIIPGKDGLLIPTEDPHALAEAMSQLQREHSRFDAQDIRDRCIARFGDEAFTRRHVEVYGSLRSSTPLSPAAR
ncbi:glycosyltransferase [Roseateles sp.]|uniref:glycosyltransferase n=1 Tax=Roseateles sp. TaxID=1971397 RepID=UPI0031DD5A59